MHGIRTMKALNGVSVAQDREAAVHARARTNPHKVKEGQVWRAWDTRGRHLPNKEVTTYRVILIPEDSAYASVERTQRDLTGKVTYVGRYLIRLDRFKPNSTGYKLLKDV